MQHARGGRRDPQQAATACLSAVAGSTRAGPRGAQILERFDTDGETDQPVGESGALARGRIHRGVGHRGRMRDETLNPTERFRQREAFEPTHELAHRIVSALELESDHGAEAPLLTPGELMPGMAKESRVPHAAHVRVALQPVREPLRVAPVMLETRMQRPQPAQRQEAVERCAGNAEAVGPPGELLVERRLARHHRAAHHIAVTIEVLGRGVDHQIRSERQRLLPGRREKRVVDHDERTAGVPEGRDRGDVGDSQERVARCLDPHERGGL